jgi:outer membrane protein assembly factor BamB
VFASPVTGVVNGVNIVFIPSYDGWIHAIVQNTGAMLWKRQLSTYTGGAWATARATIAFYSGTLIFGDNASCKLFSVNAANGNLNWVKTLVCYSSNNF